jgi:hypothetical protein
MGGCMKRKILLPFMLVFLLVCFNQMVTAQTVVADDSDGSFTILAQMVTVISPNGGENWNGGETRNITWNANASITNVTIDYSTNSGNSWIAVAANIQKEIAN